MARSPFWFSQLYSPMHTNNAVLASLQQLPSFKLYCQFQPFKLPTFGFYHAGI